MRRAIVISCSVIAFIGGCTVIAGVDNDYVLLDEGEGGQGGAGGATNASSGDAGGGYPTSDCVSDGSACDVKFATDIFGPILDVGGSAKCADLQCHGDANNVQGDLLLKPGDAGQAREALLAYQFDKPTGPYIKCASAKDSKFLCNMFMGQGVTNPYGTCGTTMPQLLNAQVGAVAITQEQLDLIEGWIACGAPNN